MTTLDTNPTVGAVALARLMVELLAIEGITVASVEMLSGQVVITVDPRAPATRKG